MYLPHMSSMLMLAKHDLLNRTRLSAFPAICVNWDT
jgi:hypothetical protein